MGGDSYADMQSPDAGYVGDQQGNGSSAGTAGGSGSGGGTGGGVGGPAGAAARAAPTKPKWTDSGVILTKVIFESLKKTLAPDAAGLQFKPTGMKRFTLIMNRKKQTTILKGFGQLFVDSNLASTTFLWSLLKSVAQSGEKLLMVFDTTIDIATITPGPNQTIVETETISVMQDAGLTFASKDLTKKIYGTLLPTGSILELTSRYDNFSQIYLMNRMADDVTAVHELLGHFFIASKGLPYKHPDSLAGTGVLDNQGKDFAGTVTDFIQIVINEARANLRAGTSGSPSKP
ncbi:hypothetical protein BH10PSE13_BH10PSE13_02820 [soil metagenome]